MLVFVILVLIWILVCRFKNRKLISLSKRLPSNFISLPFLGSSHIFIGGDEKRMNGLRNVAYITNDRGGESSIWLGSELLVVLTDAVAIELVMKICLEKDDLMKYARDLTSNGSIFAPVKIWRPRRKILAPIFSPKNLNSFMTVFSKQSSIATNMLAPRAGAGPFSIWKYLTTYTMDSVCETTLGVQMNAQSQHDQPFLRAFEIVCDIVAARMLQPWLQIELLYNLLPIHKKMLKSKKVIYEFIDGIITRKHRMMNEKRRTKQCNEDNQDNMKTFLDLLIESSNNSGGYTDIELREETLVITLAGTDTSAVGIGFTILMLAQHLDVQKKIYQEIEEVLGLDETKPIQAQDISKLKYLDAVLRETLRLYPPVPVIVRKCDRDLTLPSGLTLTKGIGMVIHIWGVHRNTKYWGEDAEDFRPERFFDSLKHPNAFMPFSCGPRNCLGYPYAMMSMKTMVASIVRKYRIVAAPEYEAKEIKTNFKHKPLRVKFDVMMKDVSNFTVQLENRTDNNN